MPTVEDATVRVEVPEPPADNATLDGLMDALSPVTGLEDSDIVPEKLLMLDRARVAVPTVPDWIVRLVVLDVMLKSGGGGGAVTVTVTLAVCETEPLVPVTVTM